MPGTYKKDSGRMRAYGRLPTSVRDAIVRMLSPSYTRQLDRQHRALNAGRGLGLFCAEGCPSWEQAPSFGAGLCFRWPAPSEVPPGARARGPGCVEVVHPVRCLAGLTDAAWEGAADVHARDAARAALGAAREKIISSVGTTYRDRVLRRVFGASSEGSFPRLLRVDVADPEQGLLVVVDFLWTLSNQEDDVTRHLMPKARRVNLVHLRRALALVPAAYCRLPARLRADRATTLAAVKLYGSMLLSAPLELQMDLELAGAAVRAEDDVLARLPPAVRDGLAAATT